MRHELGLVLRLLGPLIQVVCLIVLLTTPVHQSRFLGIPLANLLYGLFAVGFVLVVLGVTLSQRGRNTPPRHKTSGEE